jgi:hypothetical protein
MTTPTRPGKKPRPVFIVSGRTYGYEETFRDLGGKKFRGQWSFWNDPTQALIEAIEKYGKQSFAERVEARVERKVDRAERYEGYAENASARSETRLNAAHNIAQAIPPGQPILVGHHSERRHRRDLERIDTNMRKGIEESKKAEYFSHRVGSLERDVQKITQARSYFMNQIEKEEALLRKHNRNSVTFPKYDYKPLIAECEEKLVYWRDKVAEVGEALKAQGVRIATPENIKVGFRIKYTGTWYEVIRVSKKSVTIKNWLDVPKFTWKVRYVDIDDFRDPTAEEPQVGEQAKSDEVISSQQTGGAQ